jgi:hypothetical protein
VSDLGKRVGAALEAGFLLIRTRLGSRDRLKELIHESSGRQMLSPRERRIALGMDARMQRLRVSCLWRAAVVTQMLRRRGVAARMRISMTRQRPYIAHAAVEVAGRAIEGDAADEVVLR